MAENESAALTEAEKDLLEVATALFGWSTQGDALEATTKAVRSIVAEREAQARAEGAREALLAAAEDIVQFEPFPGEEADWLRDRAAAHPTTDERSDR